jgi:hypothetical protein
MRSVFSRTLIRFAAGLLFATPASPARADPITLQAGFISYSRSNQASVNWTGAGFEASGDFGNEAQEQQTPSHACFPCASGQLVNLSITESLSNTDADPNVGVGIIFRLNGETYLSRSLDFRIDAGDVRLGEIDPSAPLTLSTFTPFRFSGSLTGAPLNGSAGSDVEVALAGRGRAQMAANGEDGNWAFTLYTFESAAPIPEPGTIILLGTAAVGLGARLRRRRGSQETGAN